MGRPNLQNWRRDVRRAERCRHTSVQGRTSPATVRFGDAWLAEQVRWTVQDQVSEPPLLWAHGLEVATLPGPLVGHWAFVLRTHVDGTR